MEPGCPVHCASWRVTQPAMPHCAHLQNGGDNSSAYLTVLLWGLNELS